ncbi:MAG: hypothetical protein MRY79_03845 [Alphaproteobacteria bacterium]|nr:hypothetical protein [Alphaproteobacteria bacterium]
MAKNKKLALGHYYKHGKFVPLYHRVMDSDAYQALTFKSRCLLIELQRLEFPNRNGRIGLSETKAADILGCSPNTASAAFQELIEKEFIIRSYEGDYTRGKASEWEITYLPCKGREPLDLWRDYKPEKQNPNRKK